jgi:hypothetical protein
MTTFRISGTQMIGKIGLSTVLIPNDCNNLHLLIPDFTGLIRAVCHVQASYPVTTANTLIFPFIAHGSP